MTTKNENYVSMCRSVEGVLVAHETVWQSNTRFVKERILFGDLLGKVQQAGGESLIVTTGATADKAEAASRLFSMVTDLGKRASVYALDHDNQELHDHLRTSKGALSNMPDTVSLAKAKDMYTRMEAIKRDLADYGITEEVLDECKRLIDAYDAYITRPRDLIVERKGHNQSLSELLRDLRRCVYKLDSLMSLFSGTRFETDYRNARIIVDLGTRKKKEEGPQP